MPACDDGEHTQRRIMDWQCGQRSFTSARTVPLDCVAREELIVQRLAIRRRVGIEAPSLVAALRLDQLRMHLRMRQSTARLVRVDERDDRLGHRRR